MRVIGIDPGKSGGIAWCNAGVMQAWPMPKTEYDIFSMLRDMKFDDSFAYLEKVHAMPGQGVTSMFTFGQGYGFLRGCLTALKIPFEDVTPQKWMKGLSISHKRGASKAEKKNALKQKAQQLYPSMKIDLKIADAILLCEYGRREQSKVST
jgi:crossover junction endodeoxyribonuclease RuvC